MRRLPALAVVATLALFGPARAHASIILKATLTNGQENPPVNTAPRPASFGTAEFVLNDAMTAMTFTATVFNIDIDGTQTPGDATDNLVAAHIHAGPAFPPTNNPVVWGFFGAPFNETAPNDRVITPFAAGVGFTISGKWDATEGNGTTLAAQITNILAGRAYINFHTNQFPGGEVRGQIVPEPVSLLLFGTGLACAAAFRRVRSRRA
jgi:hypothetical protein